MFAFSCLNKYKKVSYLTSCMKKFYSTHFKEEVIHVNGQKINFIKTGNGAKNIFCYPGALGSIWSDFKPQIENLDKNKFTVIVWDPPGRGHSRPPEKFYHSNFYEEDADMAYEFLKKLGIEKCSVLGWSDGGNSSIILTAKRPENVENLIIWGSNSYIAPTEIDAYESLRDIKKWSERARAPHIALYGEELFQNLQHSWVDTCLEIFQKKNGDVCKSFLKNIKCPTLILHGDKDPIVLPEHPVYISENIKGAKLIQFPEGKHNIHLKYSEEFNEIITNFIVKNGEI